MTAGHWRNGRGKIVIQVRVARAGNMGNLVGTVSPVRIGQGEAAIHDHPARVVEVPRQRVGVNKGRQHGRPALRSITAFAARFRQAGNTASLLARILRKQIVDVLLRHARAPFVRHRLADGAGVLRRVNGMVQPVLAKLGYDNPQILDIKNYIAGHQEIEETPHLNSKDHDLIERIRRNKVTISNGRNELKSAGYDDQQIKDIVNYLDGYETMEGAPHIRKEHLAIFDCSNKPRWAKRAISPEGHVNMMAAVQPFISGAISKTVNMPEESTIEDIERIYTEAHQKGLKSIAIYRDGSKGVQVLSFRKEDERGLEGKIQPRRRKLPVTSASVRHKFNVVGHEGYLHVGLYDDGTPGEMFITMSKEGSTVGGLMDLFAVSTSLNLQHGVPLETLVKKFRHQKFEPSGLVREGHPEIKTADSIIDYIFHWLGKEFLLNYKNNGAQMEQQEVTDIKKTNGGEKEGNHFNGENEGGFCIKCGNQMTKLGNCEQRCGVCNHQDLTGCGGS